MKDITIVVFSFVLFLSITHRVNGDDNDGYEWFSEGLTPIPIRILPTVLAEVQFPNYVVMVIGKEMNLTDLSSQPSSISYPGNGNDFYCFMMIDPDAPSEDNPYESQYVQWISMNNKGQSSAGPNTYSGQDTIAPYFAPAPGTGTGKHHYIVMVFQQSNYLNNLQPLSQRTNFNYLDFASQNGLGDPIAGNFAIVYA